MDYREVLSSLPSVYLALLGHTTNSPSSLSVPRTSLPISTGCTGQGPSTQLCARWWSGCWAKVWAGLAGLRTPGSLSFPAGVKLECWVQRPKHTRLSLLSSHSSPLTPSLSTATIPQPRAQPTFQTVSNLSSPPTSLASQGPGKAVCLHLEMLG